MDLFILRHGEAGRSSATARGDSKRTLTIKGEKEIKDISKGIKELGIEFDYIFTSPLLRTRQTAELVSKIVVCKNQIKNLDELKPEGNRLQLYNKLSDLKQDSSVLLVGHEPYLSELIGEAISNVDCRIDLKKAGLARIKVIAILPKIKGELRWLLAPKHLKIAS
ncbi:MAG: phosphohistidine phosphatase SixA [Thaumarchaeota archaeon]|nr:phosphohistidine phosphatase SixA [Nitrososphaerota archaeon]